MEQLTEIVRGYPSATHTHTHTYIQGVNDIDCQKNSAER